MRARVRNGELVGVGLPGLDRRLGDERHPILVVRQLESVEVNRRRLRQFVRQINPDPIALTHSDLRPGYLIVVGPCPHSPAGLDLPLDLFAGEIVHLDALLESGLEQLVALAGGQHRPAAG